MDACSFSGTCSSGCSNRSSGRSHGPPSSPRSSIRATSGSKAASAEAWLRPSARPRSPSSSSCPSCSSMMAFIQEATETLGSVDLASGGSKGLERVQGAWSWLQRQRFGRDIPNLEEVLRMATSRIAGAGRRRRRLRWRAASPWWSSTSSSCCSPCSSFSGTATRS